MYIYKECSIGIWVSFSSPPILSSPSDWNVPGSAWNVLGVPGTIHDLALDVPGITHDL